MWRPGFWPLRRREPLITLEELPFPGPHSGVLADFAAILHETGSIDDRTFEAVLAELRDIRLQRIGNYATQQLASIQERPPVIGEVDHDLLRRGC